MSRTFRDTILRLSPPWLVDEVGSRFLYSMGVQLDALGDRLVEGMKGSHPDFAALFLQEALPLIGRDRRISRGLDEGPVPYAARLLRFLEDWPIAGNAYAIMAQLRGYLSGHAVKMRVVNQAGAWRTLNSDGSVEYHRANPTNWNWDGNASAWSRFWVVIYPPSSLWLPGPTWGSPSLWGGAWGTSGYTWGSTATPDQVASVRNIISEWKSAASVCERIIVAFDPDSFDPTSSPGTPMPDGTWGSHSVASPSRARSRLASARYWAGT